MYITFRYMYLTFVYTHVYITFCYMYLTFVYTHVYITFCYMYLTFVYTHVYITFCYNQLHTSAVKDSEFERWAPLSHRVSDEALRQMTGDRLERRMRGLEAERRKMEQCLAHPTLSLSDRYRTYLC